MPEPMLVMMDAAQLRLQSHHLSTPFVLRLSIDAIDAIDAERSARDVPVCCEAVLRLLPGKRLVARARVGDRVVLLKLFFDRRHAANADRELAGLAQMRAAGFATPDLVAQGQLSAGGGTALLLQYLSDAVPLSLVWRDADDALREWLLTALVTRLAALHARGAWQADLHFDNFLLTDLPLREPMLYAVDGGGVRRAPDIGNETFGIDNLALMHGQLPLRDDVLTALTLPVYTAARGWRVTAERELLLRQTIAQHRALRIGRYLRKIHRECTEFQVMRTARVFTVLQRDLSDELQVLLAEPDTAIAAGEVLKDGRSATVARVRGRHHWWVIKRYNLKTTLHALGRLPRRTRAEWSWRNAQRLKLLGIATAGPVALRVETLGPLRGRGYFVMQALDGTPLDEKLRGGWRPDAIDIQQMTRLISELLEQRLVHGDFKASNFVVTRAGIHLVDLDGMREVRDAAQLARLFGRDIARFQSNWADDAQLRALFQPVTAQLVRPSW